MKKFDIIVMAGQSNAAGCGWGPVTEEYIPDERIWQYTNNIGIRVTGTGSDLKAEPILPTQERWGVAEEKTVETHKVGNLALQFAASYADKCLQPDRKVLLVQANCGGTGYARQQWGVGNFMHTNMLEMVKKALAGDPGNRVVALLWHQGEHDAFENADWDAQKRYEVHKANLQATLADFYRQVGDKDIPFIAGDFCYEWRQKNQDACDAVAKAIRECAQAFGGGFVETVGLLSNNQKNGNGDDIHFCRESLHILGQRYFEKYMSIMENK